MILNIIMQYLCSFGNVYIVTDRGNARWMALWWYHHIYHTLVELLCYLWSSLWSMCRNHILSKTIWIGIGPTPAKQVVIHSNNSWYAIKLELYVDILQVFIWLRKCLYTSLTFSSSRETFAILLGTCLLYSYTSWWGEIHSRISNLLSWIQLPSHLPYTTTKVCW